MLTRMVRKRHVIPFIIGLGIFWIANAEAANEQRCAELGANCIASEPLNTNSYSYNSPYCNPADTTGSDKQMNFEGSTGAALANENGVNMPGGWTYPSSGPLFDALPKRSPALNFILQGRPEPSDVNFLGHRFNGSNPTARRSMRWYQYFSPTYQLTGGACLNRGKIFELGELGNWLIIFQMDDDHQLYGFNQGVFNIGAHDCCDGGPGSQSFSTSTATLGGKWWRFEVVVRNALPTGGVTILELWRKDVTNDGPNVKVLDTAATAFGPSVASGDSWTSAQATNFKIPTRADNFMIVPWGNGTCSGFVGLTHLLAAAWSTDAGQMIGAATEIEGGMPSPDNLRFQ